MSIYDEHGEVDRANVVHALDQILARSAHRLTRYQRKDILGLLDELIGALPPGHECIGEEEAERRHDLLVWAMSLPPDHPDYIQSGTITGRF